MSEETKVHPSFIVIQSFLRNDVAAQHFLITFFQTKTLLSLQFPAQGLSDDRVAVMTGHEVGVSPDYRLGAS